MLVREEKTYPLGSANCCVWQEHCLGTARLDINVVKISIVTNSIRVESFLSWSRNSLIVTEPKDSNILKITPPLVPITCLIPDNISKFEAVWIINWTAGK